MASHIQKKVLYLGLDPARFKTEGELIHCPLIETTGFSYEKHAWLEKKIPHITHVICTSRSCARFLLSHFPKLRVKPFFAIGKGTKERLCEYGVKKIILSEQEFAESLVDKLKQNHQVRHCYLYPRSALARPVIKEFLKGCRYYSFILYETHHKELQIDLKPIDAIVFTSPSTVDAFIKNCGKLPTDKKLIAIGPVTLAYLNTLAKNGDLHMVEA